MKLGTLVHHVYGYTQPPQKFQFWPRDLVMVFHSRKRGKIITKLWKTINKSWSKKKKMHMAHVATAGVARRVHLKISIRGLLTSRLPPDIRANGCMTQTGLWLKCCNSLYYLIKKCECLNDIQKGKMKQVSFWPSPFAQAVVMALVAMIVRQITLTTILPVSKRKEPQPSLSY